MIPDGRITPRKVGIFVIFALYGLFVLDAANVLPVRSSARMMLYGFGMDHYDDNDPVPSFMQ